MEPSESIFKPAWWGVSLPGVRPRVGTYGGYEYEPLPTSKDVHFDGSFDWLRSEPEFRGSIFERDRNDAFKAFEVLKLNCEQHAVDLPDSFVTFFTDRSLARRIRSCTACFLNVAPEPCDAPIGAGRFIRFLSDQQGGLHWYLFLDREKPGDHCVLVSSDEFAVDADELPDDYPPTKPPSTESINYCAASFEAFMFRFWIENEYWYASERGERVSDRAMTCVRDFGWLTAESAVKPTVRWWRSFFQR